jgi:WD40 repeat protein
VNNDTHRSSSKRLVPFIGHTNDILSVAFAPDRSRLASLSSDRSLILWDSDTGEMLRRIGLGTDWAYGVVYTPGGTRLITSDADGLHFWDSITGALVATTSDLSGEFALSPDGRFIAGQGEDRLMIWDVLAAKIAGVVPMPSDYDVSSIVFCPGGSGVALGLSNGFELWDISAEGSPRLHLSDRGDQYALPVDALAFSADGALLAVAHGDRVSIWSIASGECVREPQFHCGVLSVSFSPGGEVLATGGDDGLVVLWDTATWQPKRALKAHRDWVRSVVFSPDGSVLATAGNDRSIRLWDAESGDLVRTLRGHEHGVDSVCFSTDGTGLLSSHADGTDRAWNLTTRFMVATRSTMPACSYSCLLSPDGSIAVEGAGADGTSADLPDRIRLRDTATGALRHELSILDRSDRPDEVVSACFSPDGRLIAFGHLGFQVSLWDVQSGSLVGRLGTSGDSVGALAFSPDGRLLATGTHYGHIVQVFSLDTMQEVASLTDHTADVNSVAFSPGGDTLATAGSDGTLKLWEMPEGRLLITLLVLPPANDHEVSSDWLVYTPDGDYNGSSGSHCFVR